MLTILLVVSIDLFLLSKSCFCSNGVYMVSHNPLNSRPVISWLVNNHWNTGLVFKTWLNLTAGCTLTTQVFISPLYIKHRQHFKLPLNPSSLICHPSFWHLSSKFQGPFHGPFLLEYSITYIFSRAITSILVICQIQNIKQWLWSTLDQLWDFPSE